MGNYSLSLAANYLILFIREHLLSTYAVPRSVLRGRGRRKNRWESDEVADVNTRQVGGRPPRDGGEVPIRASEASGGGGLWHLALPVSPQRKEGQGSQAGTLVSPSWGESWPHCPELPTLVPRLDPADQEA